MLAIAVTGAIGGVAGSAWALQFGFVQVEVIFGLTVPLFVIVMSVLGGRTFWVGPVLGAAVIVLVQDRLAGGGFESWRPIIFGLLLALMVIFAPDGLWAQLKARPVLTGVVGATALLVVFVAGIGDVLDRIVLAMLATGVAAFWPQRLLPARLRRSVAAPKSTPVGDAPASERTSPEPKAREADVPANGVTVSKAGDDAPVAIECRGLARHYGGVRALDGLDLQIRQGELVGLIGPNGSGKTTLVNLLSGAVRPTRGSIHVVGRDVTRLAPHAINHAGVARTYQIPRPFESMTLHDNVAMAIMFGRKPHRLARARERATEYLAFVGLEQHAASRPADINLHQRQLLEMARALATDPKVLFLDESLAGLNPAEIDSAVEVVRRIHTSGVTIVIVEHLLRVVNQLAERVIVLNRGRLLADGDTQTVMRDPAVVDVYLGKSGRTVPANDTGGEHA
jgi:branched-chain amino acid transport system permease protein